MLLDLSLARPRRQPLSRALSPGPSLARRCWCSRSLLFAAPAARARRSPGCSRSAARRCGARAGATARVERRRASSSLATAVGRARLRPRPRQHAPAHVGARPRLADRRRRLVLLPARRAADRAARAQRQRRAASFLRYAWPLLFVVARAGRRDGRHARHGAAADRRLRVGRVPRRVARDVVASPQRPAPSARSRSPSSLFAALDRRRHVRAVSRRRASTASPPSRLENLAAPFASANDQLALVTWFQRAAPAEGFGLGAVPWCGFAPSRGCSGVPAQIHSDYTFTALVGVFGAAGRLGADARRARSGCIA